VSALVATFVTGLALGAVYALVGTAVATVAIAARTLHLAIGAVLAAGTLLALSLAGAELIGFPRGVAVPVAVLAGATVSAALAPLLLRRLPRGLAWLVGLAVAGAAVEALAARTLGAGTFRADPLVVLPAIGPVDGAVVTALLLGLPAALLLAVATAWTRWGRRLRLVGGSDDAARLGGIDPERTRTVAFALAGAVAVLAGLLVAPVSFVGVGQAASLTVRGVAAAALFGRDQPGWALPAGLGLGLAEAAALALWPIAGGDVAVAVVVVVILVVRGSDARQVWGRTW
jgi:branched-chain amino acid transport system permease protein